MNTLMRSMVAATTTFVLTLAAPAARSADYPTKTVTLVAATLAGGALDIVARMLAPELEKVIRQPVIVENKPGAGAQIGANAVARAAADGHTLLISTGVALVPVFSKTPLVALKDLAPVSLIAEGPLLMVVPKDVPANNMQELFNYVRANPGKFNHATVGRGSSISLYFEYWKAKERLNMQTIAYPGPGPITTALARNDVQMALLGVAVTKAFVDTGKGKAIAISGKRRLAEFPGATTFEEQGYPETGGTMVAMHAPAAVPADVIAKIHAAILQVGKSPEFVKRMEAQNFVMVLSTPDELKRREESDAKWGLDVARAAKIQPE